MRNKLRVVVDTNVLVSAALFSSSLPGQALSHAINHGCLLMSANTASELRTVLFRPRLSRYLHSEEATEFLASVLRYAEPVEITVSIAICRDPKDDKFLELAVSGQASHIVSGDQDILALHPFRGIPVMSPRNFSEIVT
ncbi:MAG: putative toxin-antitoxin system toxin component, PIN family [Chloroflexota bacterium]|nr:putative toxin-antitoxin system toxin component, PIN family [Chloroflexota bacterium]